MALRMALPNNWRAQVDVMVIDQENLVQTPMSGKAPNKIDILNQLVEKFIQVGAKDSDLSTYLMLIVGNGWNAELVDKSIETLTNLLAAGEKNAYSVVRIGALFHNELNLDHKIMLKYLLAICGNGFSKNQKVLEQIANELSELLKIGLKEAESIFWHLCCKKNRSSEIMPFS